MNSENAEEALKLFAVLNHVQNLGTRDRRARSRSEHFGIEERPRSGW